MNYNFLNLIFAILLSILIIFGWQYFYEKPRLDKLAKEHELYQEQLEKHKKSTATFSKQTIKDRNSVVNEAGRVKIVSENLKGSISTRGLRFDDLVLVRYKKTLDENSPSVELFSPANTDQSYFAELGWVGENEDAELPGINTIWMADKNELTNDSPVNFSWQNSRGVEFIFTVELKEDYLFTISQKIINRSNKPINTQFYGLINRTYEESAEQIVNILHQGFVGSYNTSLEEFSYDKVKENKRESFISGRLDWVGITDKYWLSAFIPDNKLNYSMNYSYAVKSGKDKYQADFISKPELIAPGKEFTAIMKLYAGAKKVKLLDKYEEKYNIALFDRAIDFGWLYILTKPIFYLMNFFYKYVGNFGISIMIVTVIIKLALFTLANKSYRSMKRMKKLQPQMERLKELYGDDKARLNQEVMALYKREKVNPVSGCLPLLVQIPVFFAIYKVLYVTIEMRHAPFYGWIHDLSAPDPTSIFNLFGLLPYSPPSFLMIGAWPIIMATTMFLQQRMSPEPADPVQAKVMKFMPLMFLFMFSSFPAGLLIYWSWNNILSILQQTMINKMDKS